MILNNQTILYGKGTANELVNSFKLLHSKVELNKNKTGYKIYMVLQDRNGNYSALKEADYIKDNEKPQIIKSESYFVNPNRYRGNLWMTFSIVMHLYQMDLKHLSSILNSPSQWTRHL